jgi:phosphatidylserine/phosphatidylglycerophosphate/cardiolipin synthase-like enzyme
MRKRSSTTRTLALVGIPLISAMLYFLPVQASSWLDRIPQLFPFLQKAEPKPNKPISLETTTQLQMGTSPNGGALSLVLSAIDSATTSIEVASYSFTSKKIAQALVNKHRQGIKVRVVMDKSQDSEKYSSATFLANAGIPVRINSRYAIQHSKIMIIDTRTVETGSFNFSNAAATRNSENVLVIWNHAELAKQYADYWLRLWNEATPYRARSSR